MSVTISHGIGYGSESGAMFIDMEAMKAYEPQKPIENTVRVNELGSMPWSPWGTNNLLPLEMVSDIKSCLLYSIIEGRSRFAVCQGMQPVITRLDTITGQRVIEKYCDDPEILDWLDANNMFNNTFAWIKDYIGFLRCMSRIMLNKKRDKIALLQRDDVVKTRFQKMDEQGRINNIYYSSEWNKVSGPESKNVFKKPHLKPQNPLFDLANRVTGGDTAVEYALSITHPGWDEEYYPVPMWMAAIKWIKIAQSIPEMKAAMYENSIRAKCIVIIYEQFWEKSYGEGWANLDETKQTEYRKKVYDDIEKFLVGSKNAGKAIFTTGYRSLDGKTWADIEFKPLEDFKTSGEYLPDSAAANSEIAFSMLWNNAMTGGNQKTGLYSENQGGSNVREASTLQVIVHEVERMQIKNIMNVVKHFNGWTKSHPGLEFIIPATLLTTLDTGAGSKPVLTGDIKPDENGANKNN
jgi:hypothetical protein